MSELLKNSTRENFISNKRDTDLSVRLDHHRRLRTVKDARLPAGSSSVPGARMTSACLVSFDVFDRAIFQFGGLKSSHSYPYDLR